MHIERVLALINLTDVPERKRRFWPQESIVVVSSRDRTVLDVIQTFADDDPYARLDAASSYYPETRMFITRPGEIDSIDELQDRIDNLYAPRTPDTYIVGRGSVRDLSAEEQRRLLDEP